MSSHAGAGRDLEGTPRDLSGGEHESHLGDRFPALVDGELSHDTRERVLAHLATCANCRAEADAQRRLKSVFAVVAPPPPSASFLARLQGLRTEDSHQHGTQERGNPDRSDPQPAELAAQALWALDESAGTVFGRLDQLFRALGPPPDDHQELDQIQQSGEGGQL